MRNTLIFILIAIISSCDIDASWKIDLGIFITRATGLEYSEHFPLIVVADDVSIEEGVHSARVETAVYAVICEIDRGTFFSSIYEMGCSPSSVAITGYLERMPEDADYNCSAEGRDQFNGTPFHIENHDPSQALVVRTTTVEFGTDPFQFVCDQRSLDAEASLTF